MHEIVRDHSVNLKSFVFTHTHKRTRAHTPHDKSVWVQQAPAVTVGISLCVMLAATSRYFANARLILDGFISGSQQNLKSFLRFKNAHIYLSCLARACVRVQSTNVGSNRCVLWALCLALFWLAHSCRPGKRVSFRVSTTLKLTRPTNLDQLKVDSIYMCICIYLLKLRGTRANAQNVCAK